MSNLSVNIGAYLVVTEKINSERHHYSHYRKSAVILSDKDGIAIDTHLHHTHTSPSCSHKTIQWSNVKIYLEKKNHCKFGNEAFLKHP